MILLLKKIFFPLHIIMNHFSFRIRSFLCISIYFFLGETIEKKKQQKTIFHLFVNIYIHISMTIYNDKTRSHPIYIVQSFKKLPKVSFANAINCNSGNISSSLIDEISLVILLFTSSLIACSKFLFHLSLNPTKKFI